MGTISIVKMANLLKGITNLKQNQSKLQLYVLQKQRKYKNSHGTMTDPICCRYYNALIQVTLQSHSYKHGIVLIQTEHPDKSQHNYRIWLLTKSPNMHTRGEATSSTNDAGESR